MPLTIVLGSERCIGFTFARHRAVEADAAGESLGLFSTQAEAAAAITGIALAENEGELN
jgi:hypothetical protein